MPSTEFAEYVTHATVTAFLALSYAHGWLL